MRDDIRHRHFGMSGLRTAFADVRHIVAGTDIDADGNADEYRDDVKLVHDDSFDED